MIVCMYCGIYRQNMVVPGGSIAGKSGLEGYVSGVMRAGE